MDFKRTESITRRLNIMVCGVILFFGLILGGFYFSSRVVLSDLGQLYLVNQMYDLTRQILQVQETYSELFRNFSPGSDQARNQSILRAAEMQERQLFLKGTALSATVPQAHALFSQAQNAAERYREVLKGILMGGSDFRTEILIAKQFELETKEPLNKVQILLKTQSDRYFDEIYKRRFYPLITAVGLTLIFMFLSLIMGVGLIRRFNLAIGELLGATAQVARGNLDFQACIIRPDEMGQLTNAFNQMIANLRDSTVSKQMFENIIESMTDSLVLVDSQGRILQVNRETTKLFDYTIEELKGRRCDILFGDGFRLSPAIHNFETECTSKSGKSVPVSINVSELSGHKQDLVCVIHDISERKKAENDLRARNLDLAAANRELEAFSYSVSHDLRAPLRGIDGFSQALIEDLGPQLEDEDRKYLERIRAGVQRMGRLIDDMLGLSKLSRKELTLGQVDLSTMVREIFSELKRNEPQRDAELLVRDVIKVTADADLMHIMLENLIGNAWKYSSKKPTTTIEIGTAVRNNQSMIYIRDNGAGFDMTYSQRLFEAFQRLHRADEFPGTGVGLATVQRIVHRHGGTICAESEINKGATFYFALGKC